MSNNIDPGLDLRDVANIEAWVNPQWKDDLQRDAQGAMRALAQKYSLDIPDDVEFKVHEDSEQVYNVVLSPSPSGPPPAESASEVQGFLAGFSLSAAPTEARGSTNWWGCNEAICSATTTRCYSHCISAAP